MTVDAASEEVVTGTSLVLTKDPAIDALLLQVADGMDHDLAAAYVYGNLMKCPPLTVAAKKRSVYKVKGGSGFEYSLSDLDIAWLARSLWGEGGRTKKSAGTYAWTMFNRFMLLYHAEVDAPEQVVAVFEGKAVDQKAKRFASFWRMILDFSQPVNPKWRRDGIYCKPGGSEEHTEMCAPAKLAERERTSFGEPNPTTVGFAEAFAIGKLPYLEPSRFVNFGATAYGIAHGTKVGKDYFLTIAQEREQGVGWPGGTVVPVRTRDYIPEIDTGTPLPYSYLLSHLRALVAGDQRARSNQITIARTDLAAKAAYEAQVASNQKTQQLANAVQTTITTNDAVVASISTEQAVDAAGVQAGSDNSWGRG